MKYILLAFLLPITAAVAQTPARPGRHALDPLSGPEITRAVSILRASGRLTDNARFGTISVQPQRKDAPGSARAARIVGFDWTRNEGFVAVVNLATNAVDSWTVVGDEPPMRLLVIRRAEEIAHADPRWVAAMRSRNIDTGRVSVLVGMGERDRVPRQGTDRVVRGNIFLRDAVPEAFSPSGVSMSVNLTQGRLQSFQDTPSAAPRGDTSAIRALATSTLSLAPLRIEQPQGSAARITGNIITWDKWALRVGVDPRMGIEIHDVAYTDGTRRRPVLYSGSITEIVAPYGDPSFSTWYPRDEGDYGMGIYSMSSAVELNDAPANAAFLSATSHDHLGRPITVPRAIAVYERDGGMLWRHANVSRRGRQLVVSGYSTIDNYDYQFNWIFSQDGAIDGEVVLSGVMNTNGTARVRDSVHVGEHTSFGHLVAPRINAPNHQHFFGYRLDLDVDGVQNTVFEMETHAPPTGAANPKGETFGMTERPLTSERAAIRDVSFAASRAWRVVNTHEKNALGQFTGYALVPSGVTAAYPLPNSAPMRMSGFIAHQLWITPHAPDELYAGGEFQNLNLDDQGLPTWTRADRPLADTDVVLWHTVGVTHIPRPEDWPYMPAHRAGFRLIPASFFAKNPALDVGATRR
jgi:primary-amine oxidase